LDEKQRLHKKRRFRVTRSERENKHPFLAANDYGQGGIWMYIDTRSAAEIAEAYPELTVFEEPPEFIARDDLKRIEQELHFDIDLPPSGFLAELVAARDR
jgi:hypothetical protein